MFPTSKIAGPNIYSDSVVFRFSEIFKTELKKTIGSIWIENIMNATKIIFTVYL